MLTLNRASVRGLLRRLVMPVLCSVLLFGIFSVYRSRLIPYNASYEDAQWLLTGDEPSYLLIAQALARGDGLNVRPAHDAGDYKKLQSRPVLGPGQYTWDYYLSVGFNPTVDRSAKWGDGQVLQFSPLLPLLISPLVYHTDHVRWWIALVQALAVSIACFAILASHSIGKLSGLFHLGMVFVFALGALPAGYYAAQVFPETVAGLFLLLFLFLNAGETPGAEGSQRPLLRLMGSLFLVSSLFATPRVIVGILGVTVFGLWRAFRRRRWVEILVLLGGWTGYVCFNIHTWGTLLPPQAQGLSALYCLPDDSPYNPQLLLKGTILASMLIVVLLGVWHFPRVRRPACYAALIASTWAIPMLEIPLLAVSSILALYELKRRRWVELTVMLIGWAGRMSYNLCVSGSVLALLPTYMTVGAGKFAVLPVGFLHVFFGNDVGLFFLSPFAVLGVVAGAYLVVKRQSQEVWAWFLLFFGVMVVIATYPDFRAGTCPAGRYQVILAYLLVFPLFKMLQSCSESWYKRMLSAMYVWGILGLAIAFKVALHPNYWYRKYHPLFAHKTLQPFYGILPASDDWTFILKVLAWTCVLALPFFLYDGARFVRRRAYDCK